MKKFIITALSVGAVALASCTSTTAPATPSCCGKDGKCCKTTAACCGSCQHKHK